MQINAPATVTPVVNINQPTEALRTDIRRLERIPESNQSTESARLRQGGAEQESAQRIPEGARDQQNNEELKDENESSADGNRSSSQTEQQEQREIRELKATDREVRAHEAAHASVGGVYAGNPSFTFITGPDGVRYAVAGEVPIDVSKVPNNPAETLDKMQQVRRAALAPADPSSQDRQVAARATAIAAEASAQLARQRVQEGDENDLSSVSSTDNSSIEGRQGSPDNRDSELNAAAQNRFIRRLQSSGAVTSPPAGSNINTQA